MTGVHERIVEALESKMVEFEVIEHAPAASAQQYQQVLKTKLEEQAKALLVKVYRRGQPESYAVVSVPAHKRADLPRVAAALGADNASLADAASLERVTGCRFGELPPLGRLFGLPLVLDADLFTQSRIYFNAGSLTRSIALDPRRLKDVDQPVLV